MSAFMDLNIAPSLIAKPIFVSPNHWEPPDLRSLLLFNSGSDIVFISAGENPGEIVVLFRSLVLSNLLDEQDCP